MEESEKINEILERGTPQIYGLLSKSGKAAFFPKGGILAQAAEAKRTTINATIGQAFEDNGEPMVLETFFEQVNLPKQAFFYSPSYGQKNLRKLWKDMIKEKNPSLRDNTSLPIVTNGLSHGLFLAGELLLDEEEKIIIPDKFWGNYRAIFKKAHFDQFPCFKDGKFNLEGLKEKLSADVGKKVLLLNFPNNPSGYTPLEEEADEIAEVIKNSAEKGNKIAVLCDDAYFGLVYEEGLYRESIFSKLADLHENVLAVKIDGISKEAYSWGLRVGFLTYGFKGMDPETASILEDKTSGLVRGTISTISTISQFLAMNALGNPDFFSQAREKYENLKQRYDLVKKVLGENDRYKDFFEALPFNSGYFMCIRLKGRNADYVRRKLIENFGTGVISSGDDLLRIAYSSMRKEDVPQLFENVYLVCKSLQ